MTMDPFVSVPLSELVDSEIPGSVPRGRRGRPLIRQVDGTCVPYQRISTASGLPVTELVGLTKWRMYHAVLAVARDEGLAGMIAACQYGDPRLKDLIETACERSAAMTESREYGSAMHAFTEPGARREHAPARMRTDLEGYDAAMKRYGLTREDSEIFVVHDTWRVAGTFDGLYRDRDGRLILGDLKTGALHPLSCLAQLAMYHGGRRYDPATGVRTPIHPKLDEAEVIVIHSPKGTGVTEVYRGDTNRAYAIARNLIDRATHLAAEKFLLQLDIPVGT